MSLNVVLNDAFDSVRFFFNGKEFCKPIDDSLFTANRGKEGYQGKREYFRTSQEFNYLNVTVCSFGAHCDSVEWKIGDVFAEIYSKERIDTVRIDSAKWSRQYRIFAHSDSSWIRILDDGRYKFLGCNADDFCIENHYATIAMCIDSLYDNDVYKNACTGGWLKD